MRIQIDATDLAVMAARLRAKGKSIRPVVAMAINWTGARAATQVKRTLAAQMGTSFSKIGDSIKIIRASARRETFDIVGRGSPISLINFNARQVRKGVSARPWGVRRVFKSAFIAPAIGGAEQVFVRVGKGRLPIRKLWGPSVPREMLRGKVPIAFKEAVRINLAPRLSHEVARALGLKR